jgi:hypothetical protein
MTSNVVLGSITTSLVLLSVGRIKNLGVSLVGSIGF